MIESGGEVVVREIHKNLTERKNLLTYGYEFLV